MMAGKPTTPKPVRCPVCKGRGYITWECWGDSSSPWRTDNGRGSAWSFRCKNCGAHGVDNRTQIGALKDAAIKRGAELPKRVVRLISDEQVRVTLHDLKRVAAYAWLRAMPGWTLESAIAPIAHIFDGDTVAAMDFLVGYRNDRTENKKSG